MVYGAGPLGNDSRGDDMSAEEETRNGAGSDDAVAEGLFLDPDDDMGTGSDAELVAELNAKIEALEAEKRELNDRYLRKAADLENQRRRHIKDKEDQQMYAAESVLREMVSVLDDLDRAVDHVNAFARGPSGSSETQNVAHGVEMVLRKFTGALEKQGVKAITATGQRFDPTLHEAIQQVEDRSVPAGTVVSEFQKAYMLHARLLRPALVVVAHGGTRENAANEDGTIESEE